MRSIHYSFIVLFLFFSLPFRTTAQNTEEQKCIFKSGLHYTVRGMSFWYDKDKGGLESITGVAYDDLTCKNCHTQSCDACHKSVVNGKAAYSNSAAKDQDMCLKCHAREAAIVKINDKNNTQDVHFAAGMKCMDCHTAREMHGDGIEFASMKDPGAVDTKCENCHDKISKSISHSVHEKNLDCKACHVSQVVSCTNCHFETMVKEGKRVAIPVSGWEFLMNSNGKVTSANMQTFVVPGNKTFMMFAPQFSHSVLKTGKKCEECHGNENVEKVKSGSIDLTWMENETVKQTRGVIPVVDGVKYNTVYQNYENGKWTTIKNAAEPKLQYVGYGSPLTKEQLNKMAMKQKSK